MTPGLPTRLILASASPRRRELLAALGVPFDVRPVQADETVLPDAVPADAVREIALRKLAEARRLSSIGDCILVADTIVVLDGRVLGKPVDAAEARAMLAALRGRGHDVLTAVTVEAGGATETVVVTSAVGMRNYTAAEVEASIAAGTPFDKAGSYAIQDPLLQPVARLDGCYCNVMGLPLWTVYHRLRRLHPEPAPRQPDAAYPRCAACPLASD